MTTWKDSRPNPFTDQEFLCVLFDDEPHRLLQKLGDGFNREVYTGYYDDSLRMFIGDYPHASGDPFPFVVACRSALAPAEGYDPNDWGNIYYYKVLGELVPKDSRAYNEAKRNYEARMKQGWHNHG